MEMPDIQSVISRIDEHIFIPAKKLIDQMPPEYVPLIIGTATAVAFIVTLLVIIVSRPSKKKSSSPSVLKKLHKEGAIIDVALPGSPTAICGRAVITSIKKDRIKMEMLENSGSVILKPELEVLFMFRPENTSTDKINSFTARLLKTEKKNGLCTSFSAEMPEKFSNTPRRQHRRKRVVDQQFIRVKIWAGDIKNSRDDFSDSVPDLAVNSYDPRAGGQEENSIINISNGGIAVSAINDLVDERFTTDSDVLLNIFMFNFRQKIFKPYWYAGKIRSLEEKGPDKTRLGIEFTHSGIIQDEDEQLLQWYEL
nr:PilZ domain-containing protein [Maridesulfovibrio bastinii]